MSHSDSCVLVCLPLIDLIDGHSYCDSTDFRINKLDARICKMVIICRALQFYILQDVAQALTRVLPACLSIWLTEIHHTEGTGCSIRLRKLQS